MNPRSRRLAGTVLVVVLLPLFGCTMTGGLAPSASVTTAVQGWEHYLRVDWTSPTGGVLDGYLYSRHGSPIANVRLLAQALDAGGNVVGQKIEWVAGTVPGLQRTYFRIPNMPAGAQYRVTVWQFETLESPSYL